MTTMEPELVPIRRNEGPPFAATDAVAALVADMFIGVVVLLTGLSILVVREADDATPCCFRRLRPIDFWTKIIEVT